MSWLRLDDGFPQHPKIAGLSDRAFRLHVHALCYCSLNLTDGALPEPVVRGILAQMGVEGRARGAVLQEILRHELWVRNAVGDAVTYVIHDYLDYQRSRAQVDTGRARGATRTARWRAHRNGVTNGVSDAAPSVGVGVGVPEYPGRTYEEEVTSPRGNGGSNAVTAQGEPLYSCPGCGALNEGFREECWQCQIVLARA